MRAEGVVECTKSGSQGGGWRWRNTRGAIPACTDFKWMGGGSWGEGASLELSPGIPTGKEAEAPAKETTKVSWPLDPETRCILTPIPTPRYSSQ